MWGVKINTILKVTLKAHFPHPTSHINRFKINMQGAKYE